MDLKWILVRHVRMPLERKCCNMIGDDGADDNDDVDDDVIGKLHVCTVQL